MGLASLFRRRKTNYFKSSIEPQCAYCQFGNRTKDGGRTLCEKRGLMEENSSCKKFVYSPLKRIPVKQLNIEGAITAEEMYVEISDEELAAKQAAAAKADAAEKAHADKVKANQEAEAKAKAEAEAKAKAEAEAKAKAEAEAKAKAEAAAKAKAEAEAKAKAEAEAKAKAAAPAAQNPADEIAQAAAAAEAAAKNLNAQQPAPAPAPVPHIAAPAQPGQAPVKSAEDAAKAAAAASISEFKEAAKAAASDLDDEFADLDSVDEADVVVAQEHEVMKSKKQRLVAESEKPKGPLPNLPSASAFIRSPKKGGKSAPAPAKPPVQAMHQVPPKSQNSDQK